MKKGSIYLLLFAALFVNFSCSTTKDITMFQEAEIKTTAFYVPPSPPDIKIKPADNLYVSILTLDPEVNKILNPSTMGSSYSSGTSQMFGDPAGRYINGYRVSSDSILTLPMIGKVNFVGLNLAEAEVVLKKRAEEFLKDPEIQIKFLNYKINVTGEVRVPGVYYNYEGGINILDAISMGQGITEFADLKKVVVKRQGENRIITHIVNLTNNSVYASDVFYLQPNDLIYIPPSNLKRRSANSDTYSKLLGTISTLLVAAALFLRL